jgi:hypothetical protein
VLCCQIFFELVYLLRVGFETWKEWKLFLARKFSCYWFFGLLCVAHLRLRRLRGKKSTPSIGWEVPMRSWDWEVKNWVLRKFQIIDRFELFKIGSSCITSYDFRRI